LIEIFATEQIFERKGVTQRRKIASDFSVHDQDLKELTD
jgi:hypothetical protein